MRLHLISNRRLLFYSLCIAYICGGSLNILPGPTLPLLAAHTGVSLPVAGWIFTAGAAGFMVGAILAGITGRNIAPRYIISSSLTIIALAGIITPLTHSFALLFVAQFLLGTGMSILDVSINMIVTLSFEDTLGESLNNLHSSYGIGALVAPLLLSLSLELTQNATWAYLISSLTGLISLALVMLLYLPSVPQQRIPVQQHQQHAIPSILTILRRSFVWLMALQLALYVGAEITFSNWLTTAISQSAVITLALAAPAVTIFWAGLTAGRLLGAQVLRHGILKENTLLAISIAGGGISGLLVAAFIGIPGVSFTMSACVGLFFGPIFPLVIGIASRRFVHAVSLVSSIMLISSGVAGMIFPVLTGILIPAIGVNLAMTVPAFVCLAILIPFLLVLWQQRTALQSSVEVHTIEQETKLPLSQ